MAYDTIVKLLGVPGSEFCKLKIIKLKHFRDNHSGEEDFECLHYDSKLDESISRARNKIFELAFCNEWQFFFTGTLSPDRYDRYNLETFHKDLTKWISNYAAYRGLKIDFLLCPEPHKDGAWHIHGLLNGLDVSKLHLFTVDEYLPSYVRNRVRSGFSIYSIPEYEKKFGWMTMEPIRNKEAVSNYIRKYMTKELASTSHSVGSHLYYHSRGLNFAVDCLRGIYPYKDLFPDFENDFCQVTTLDYSQELYQHFENILLKEV